MIPTAGLFPVWYLLTGVAAGLLGAVLGLGGGVLMVPILSVVLGLPIKYAVATTPTRLAA
ncbi:MAG: TSUP family transporter, partial [bacterium]